MIHLELPFIVLISPGMIIILIGVILLFKAKAFLGKSHSAVGTVVSIDRRETESVIHNIPRIRFTTESENEIEFSSTTLSVFLSLRIGNVIPVLYDQRCPENAKISSFISIWLFPLLVIFSGVLMIVMIIFPNNMPMLT